MNSAMLNEINLKRLDLYQGLITIDPKEAISSYGITAKWQGGVNTRIETHNQKVGSKEVVKDYSFNIGEPEELLGENNNPTPQDYLLGGLAGCMMVGFVVGASNKGIKLEDVQLHITGDLDLRGFLNVDNTVPIGFNKINFQFEIKGDGKQEDYDELIRNIQEFSPNYRTITDKVEVSLLVE